MAETITIRTSAATDVIKVIEQGPQGPAGSGSGQVTSVNGQTGVVVLDAASVDASEVGHGHQSYEIQSYEVTVKVDGAGNENADGIYIRSGTYNGKSIFYKNKDTFIYWDNSNWFLAYNTNDIYLGTDATNPWDSTWSVSPGLGPAPAPILFRGNLNNFEQVIGARTATQLFAGTASTKDVGTGANDVAAGNHSHGNITTNGRIGTTSGLPIKTGSGGALVAGAFGSGAGEFCEGNDARLSDSRNPLEHKDAHLPNGVDPIPYVDGAGRLYDVDDIGALNVRLSHTTGATGWTVYDGDGFRSAISAAASGAITSSGLTAGNHKVFYSNGSGQITELPLGAANTVLTSNGATSAPTFAAPAASGATNLWIPASAFIPKTTAGCGVDSRETTTNDQNFDELLFDAGSDEFADALVVMPSNYNNGTITARFYWTASAAGDGTDDVVWGISGLAYANDDALDTATGMAQTVTDTLLATNDMHVTSATSAVTIGGTPAANKPIQFTVYRDANAAGDTYGGDARLLGVEIIFN